MIFHTIQPNTKKNNKLMFTTGFTMIETLVAITVLLLSITGPLTIAAKGVTSAAFARDQIIAFHLAREAVELIRNQRDNNTITSAVWTNGLSSCFTPSSCKVETTTGIFSACMSGNCPILNMNTSTGIYGYTNGASWKESPFTRTITIEPLNTYEISVSVSISWSTGVLSKSFTIKENFLNWQ